MATLTTTSVEGFAHCRDPRCAGTEQEPVAAVCHTSEWTYVENGGNMPGVERSTDHLAFADEATDAPCPVCSSPRELSVQARPHYTPLSGHRQDGLLHVKSYDASAQPAGNDAIVAQLMAQVAALSAQIAGNAVPAPAVPAPVVTEDMRIEQRAAEIKQRRLDAKAARAKGDTTS